MQTGLREKFWIVEDEPLSFNNIEKVKNKIKANQAILNINDCLTEDSGTTSKNEFICHICGKLMLGKNCFNSHLNRHKSKTLHSCKICSKKFTQSCSLKYHQRTHTGESPFVCQICLKSFKALSNLKSHSFVHSDYRPYACGICNKCFKTKFSLNIHFKNHTLVIFKCKLCPSILKSRKALSAHNQKKHKNFELFTCPQCKKSYQYDKLLKQHMKMHSNIKSYFCVICGTSFVWRSGLSSHMKTHSFKIPCENCPLKFTSLKKLEKHRWKHSNSQPHKCDKCTKKFKYAYLLKAHLSKHKDQMTCSECKIGFITKSKMKEHMKQHLINTNSEPLHLPII